MNLYWHPKPIFYATAREKRAGIVPDLSHSKIITSSEHLYNFSGITSLCRTLISYQFVLFPKPKLKGITVHLLWRNCVNFFFLYNLPTVTAIIEIAVITILW